VTQSDTRPSPIPVAKLAAPSARQLLGEARLAGDLGRMLLALSRQPAGQVGNGRRVMCIPGFGGSDRYTFWLRRFLNQHGFKAEGWALGTNRGGDGLTFPIDYHPIEAAYKHRPELDVPRLVMQLREQVRQRSEETGEQFALVGHSLGGYLAREVTRQLPEQVDQLITFGSPIYGGPKYTAAARVFQRRGVDLDWIEAIIAEREKIAIAAPITTIVSPSDGVVGYQAAIDRNQAHAKLIEINAHHMGMAFNPAIWQLILSELIAAARQSV